MSFFWQSFTALMYLYFLLLFCLFLIPLMWCRLIVLHWFKYFIHLNLYTSFWILFTDTVLSGELSDHKPFLRKHLKNNMIQRFGVSISNFYFVCRCFFVFFLSLISFHRLQLTLLVKVPYYAHFSGSNFYFHYLLNVYMLLLLQHLNSPYV